MPKDDDSVPIRLDRWLYDIIHRLAVAEHETISRMLRKLVEEALSQREHIKRLAANMRKQRKP